MVIDLWTRVRRCDESKKIVCAVSYAIPVKEKIIEIEAFEKGIRNAAGITNEEKDIPSNMVVTSQPIPEPTTERVNSKGNRTSAEF